MTVGEELLLAVCSRVTEKTNTPAHAIGVRSRLITVPYQGDAYLLAPAGYGGTVETIAFRHEMRVQACSSLER